MTLLFALSNALVLPFWLAMIVLPRWRWTIWLMRSPWVVAAPALLYLALLVPIAGDVARIVTQPQLASIAAMLGTPAGATLAWTHLVAFDLFVGRWIFLDGRTRNASPLAMAPILSLTLLLGPLGFLVYLATRVFGVQTAAAR